MKSSPLPTLSAKYISPSRILCLGVLLTFVGCGTTAPVVAPPAVGTANTLAGNWLLYGTLPKFDGSSSSPSGLGISIDVIGNNVLASAAIDTTCSSPPVVFTARFSAVILGDIAADGSFTASTPPPSLSTALTITGVAPKVAGSPWSGTYTFTTPNSLGALCSVSQGGSFTATPVQDLNGTYTGAGSLFTFPVATPVSMSLTLSQGAPLYSSLGPPSAPSRLGIAGSIQIQGISCFSKGTISTSAPSVVEGGPFLMTFAMDDGSTLQVLGGINDTAASQLDIDLLQVTGGSCSGIYSFGLNFPLVVKH